MHIPPLVPVAPRIAPRVLSRVFTLLGAIGVGMLGALGFGTGETHAAPAPTLAASTASRLALGAPVTHRTRELVMMNVGDSLVPAFAIRTDTVLAVRGTVIVARAPGVSVAYLRYFSPSHPGKPGTMLSGDSVDVVVRPVGTPPAAKVARVDICASADTAAFRRYQVSGDTTTDPALVPCLPGADTVRIGGTKKATATAYDSTGHVLTGRPIQWQVPPAATIKPSSFSSSFSSSFRGQ